MNKIAVKIIRQEDFDLVLNVLKAFEKKRMISLLVEGDDLTMEGPPVSFERLNKEIEAAENSETVSAENAKALFKRLRQVR